jgi:hypothetical protein
LEKTMSIKGIDNAFWNYTNGVPGKADADAMIRSARDTVATPGGEGTAPKPMTVDERVRLMEHSTFEDHFPTQADAERVRAAAWNDIKTPQLFATNLDRGEQLTFLQRAAAGLDHWLPVQNDVHYVDPQAPLPAALIRLKAPLAQAVSQLLQSEFPGGTARINHGTSQVEKDNVQLNVIYSDWHNDQVLGFVVRGPDKAFAADHDGKLLGALTSI